MPPTVTSEPWYARTCREPPLDLPSFAGRIETMVAIVGGGLAGIATALSLAERGVPAILLEAAAIGGGASGRNGGIISAGFTRSSLDLTRRLGPEPAKTLHAASHAALTLIRARIEQHAIACGLVDGLVVASVFDAPAALRGEAARLNQEFGMRLEVLPRARMRALYQSPFYTEGLFDPDGFHLDPLALARGYARAARDRGARLFETSPVLRLARHGAGWRLATADGSVEARHVVLCTNAHGDALLPALRAGLLPVASYVIVTEPLGRRLTDVIRAPYAVYDDRFATGYYRPLADGRLLWGGRIALRERPASLPALMLGDLARIYPQLEAVRLDAAWSGRMSFARHRMPILGELAPGLWANTAYGGHGLNGTTMGGELVARAIAQGDPAITLFRAFPPRPVFGLLGRLAAQGFYWGHALGDAARRRRTRRRPRGEKGEGTAPSRDPSK